MFYPVFQKTYLETNISSNELNQLFQKINNDNKQFRLDDGSWPIITSILEWIVYYYFKLKNKDESLHEKHEKFGIIRVL